MIRIMVSVIVLSHIDFSLDK